MNFVKKGATQGLLGTKPPLILWRDGKEETRSSGRKYHGGTWEERGDIAGWLWEAAWNDAIEGKLKRHHAFERHKTHVTIRGKGEWGSSRLWYLMWDLRMYFLLTVIM